MITITKMGIADTPLFKSQVFEFKPGISYIYGLNRANKTKDRNGNAVGKSRFFSRLGELIYDEPIVGIKADKNKVGKSFVDFTRDDTTYRILSVFNGKSEQISIIVDGHKTTYDTPTKAKLELRKIFPLTKDDFDSYGYLDARVPHPLVRGSSTERKRFFTSFFTLDRIDAERKLFAAELLELKRVRAAFNELKKSYDSQKETVLSDEDYEAFTVKVRRLSKKFKHLQSVELRSREVRQLLEFERQASKQIKLVTRRLPDLTDEQLELAIMASSASATKAERVVRDAHKWESYQHALAAYEAKLKPYGDVGDVSQYKKKHFDYTQAKLLYDLHMENELTEPTKPKVVKAPEGDIEDARRKVMRLSDSIDHARRFKKGVCETCGQSVKTKDVKALRAQLEAAQEELDAHEDYAEFKVAKASYIKAAKAYEAWTETKSKYVSTLRSLKTPYKLYEALGGIAKPGEPEVESKLSVEEAEANRDRALEVLNLLKFARPQLDLIRKLAGLTTAERTQMEAEAKVDASLLGEVQVELDRTRAKLLLSDQNKEVLAKTRARLVELRSKLKEEQALKLLVAGYSDKGLKRMAIESISSRLMGIVNHYAQQVLPGYTFSFNWGTQISILAHRPNGEVSDVRKLSGAESMLFTLILIPALLAFTPQHKRVSLLVLDEPAASFSEATLTAFHELLPHLAKLIPSIVVITPKVHERVDGSTCYTVLRTADGATIKEGHPENL